MKSKILILITLMATVSYAQHGRIKEENFKSQRISATASFIVNANITHVFPLYGAFEERKWAPGWEPELIYPEDEIIEEGTTFRVQPHDQDPNGEGHSLWVVTKYEPDNFLIQYLVSTENRFWTITVASEPAENNTQTKTTVTYTYTGLNEKGNKLNQANLDKMYENDLQDWADLINSHLEEKTPTSH